MRSSPGMHKSFWEFHNAYEHRLQVWKADILLTWEWWLGIALTILPRIIWLCIREKKYTGSLLFAGTLVTLISSTIDTIGIQVGAWNYLKPVTPSIPSYLPYDYALMPVIILLLIQFFMKKNPWIIGSVFGLLAAFIGEPLFEWLKIYEAITWKHWYSVPFYILIYYSAFKIATVTKK